MRIAHFGTFDVANYGDLLFPRLLEWRLADIADEIVHISPVGGIRIYRDVPVSHSLADVQRAGSEFDAVVVGGGNIIHDNGTNLATYKSVKSVAYPRLWLGATQLATRQRIPLVVNAPGVPKVPGRTAAPLMRRFASRADYLSVRDTYSQEVLRSIGVPGAAVVPDSALELRDMFTTNAPANLDVPTRLTETLDSRFAAVHINARYKGGDVASLARRLDELSATLQGTIVLIAIGPCHGDDEFAETVAAQMQSDPVVFGAPKAVEDIAYVISRSCAYIGSSMHGFITAASFGVPGLIVASHAAQHKFRGVLAHLDAEERLVSSWDEALNLLGPTGDPSALAPVAIEPALTRINDHWTELRTALQGGTRPITTP
ncbi:polysaccharide pyruvyl transferase family protein [Microbacterium sp. NPDC087589]|uniref:polysaccharide pyruvyl transferase family protein n=1 Tax=Microbacterium sp. NPDC087589 TaxID=3364191 RepID=UPI0038152589